MKILVGYVLGLALAFAASLIVQDIFLFAEVRDRIDRTIVDLTLSEAAPNAATRAAFELDDPNLYWQEAFDHIATSPCRVIGSTFTRTRFWRHQFGCCSSGFGMTDVA